MENEIKILTIDDDANLQKVLKKVLESKAYRVIQAADGEEGLRKVVDEKPDLIILDVIMPGKTGFDVCHELKTDEKYYFFSRIPVLMLTVYPDEKEEGRLSMREGMTMEAEDYMHKPIDPEELLNRVKTLLEERAR